MKLTVRQNQVLKFIQANTTDWFQWWHDLHNKYFEQGGQGDVSTVVYNLVGEGDKGMLEKRVDKVHQHGGYQYETWFRLTPLGKAQKIGRTKEYKKNTGPVTSNDPRKKIIVAEMKRRSGGTKVTNIKETATHFVGNPMKRVQSKEYGHMFWNSLPEIQIPKSDFKFGGA